MRPNVYENKEEGIKCVYTNEKWLVSRTRPPGR